MDSGCAAVIKDGDAVPGIGTSKGDLIFLGLVVGPVLGCCDVDVCLVAFLAENILGTGDKGVDIFPLYTLSHRQRQQS